LSIYLPSKDVIALNFHQIRQRMRCYRRIESQGPSLRQLSVRFEVGCHTSIRCSSIQSCAWKFLSGVHPLEQWVNCLSEWLSACRRPKYKMLKAVRPKYRGCEAVDGLCHRCWLNLLLRYGAELLRI